MKKNIRVWQYKTIDLTDEKMVRQGRNLVVPLLKLRLNKISEITEVEISGLWYH